MSKSTNQAPVVIVGTGLAGYTLARELRKLDKAQAIVMVTADDGHSYSKPMLSTAFSRDKTADDLSMSGPDQMAKQLNVDIRTFTVVTGIAPEQNRLFLAGESLVYSKLILAWGADVVQLALAGDATDQVCSINDLQDYRHFRNNLEDKKRVLILGAGLIGCEFANDMRNGGYQVEIVAPSNQVIPGLLPAPCATALQSALASEHVRFHLERTVTAVNHKDGAICASLSDGSIIETDMVISAVGLRPRTQLVKNILECNQGIVVNRALETSHADIYALGDCAEVEGRVMLYVQPLMTGARALAKTLTGQRTEVKYSAMPVVIKTPICPIAVAPPPANETGTWSFDGDGKNIKGLFKDTNDNLLGFALTGNYAEERQALTKLLPDIQLA
ncbi:MAG: FAD-dependent oxidoreductase [Gammaproteobacteria bacterium]|nr:MAG: FAD-dependent oxidoreductase [Gammaproteobacteria bacterium]